MIDVDQDRPLLIGTNVWVTIWGRVRYVKIENIEFGPGEEALVHAVSVIDEKFKLRNYNLFFTEEAAATDIRING